MYVDVDRRYFNDNHPPFGSPTNYATIDVKPGYQKLCGADALDYVRYRHLDNDFVRAARQQDFLRQAKDQFGLGTLFGSRKELLRVFARYTQTDIHSTSATLRLLKLAFESSKNPVREVHFRGGIGDDVAYVEITDGEPAPDARRVPQRPGVVGPARDRTPDQALSREQARHRPRPDPRQARGRGLRAPTPRPAPASRCSIPRVRLSRGATAATTRASTTSTTAAKHRYRAYRIVVYAGRDRPVLRRAGHDLERAADHSTARRRRASSAGASSSCSSTAAGCG